MASVVRRYYLVRATGTGGFIGPVFALFVLRDLSYVQYGTLSAIYAALLVGGEIPSGYVSDRIGRRNTMIASKAMLAASMFGFVAVESFGSYLVVYVLWGVGMALRSGSQSAWLYETLDDSVGSNRFTAVRGRGTAVAQGASIFTMFSGGILYALSPPAPFVAAGGVLVVGAIVAATLPPNERYGDAEARATAGRPTARATLELFRNELNRPRLRSSIFVVAVLFGVVGAGNQYVQPVAVVVFEEWTLPAAVLVAGPETASIRAVPSSLFRSPAVGLGALYAGFSVVAAVASYYADAVDRRLGLQAAFALVTAFVVGTMALSALYPPVAFAVFFALQSARRLLEPMVEKYLNDRISDVGRATALSGVSMLFGLARTPLVAVAGLAAEHYGPLATFPTLAVLLLALTVPVGVFCSPFASGVGTRLPADAGRTP